MFRSIIIWHYYLYYLNIYYQATRSLDKYISVNDSYYTRVHSGQYSWIDEGYAEKHLSSLNTRIECFTGLSTESAEPYRIINYGLSGPNNTPHLDAHRNQTVCITINKDCSSPSAHDF